MSLRVTALFSQTDEAEQAMRELEISGFDCIRVDRESSQFSRHEPIGADDLVQLGVAGAEASFYATLLEKGASLLVIETDKQREDELATIIQAAGLLEVPTPESADRLRFESPQLKGDQGEEIIDESGVHRSSTFRDEFQRADSERFVGEHDSGDASGLSRRAYGGDGRFQESEPPEIPRPAEPLAEDGQQPGTRARLPGPYDKFEEAFRNHYDDNFYASPFTYDRFLTAYRFGLLLAHEEAFDDMSWAELEPFARESWDSQTNGPWQVFSGAVKYGWELRRQHGDSRRSPPLQ